MHCKPYPHGLSFPVKSPAPKIYLKSMVLTIFEGSLSRRVKTAFVEGGERSKFVVLFSLHFHAGNTP